MYVFKAEALKRALSAATSDMSVSLISLQKANTISPSYFGETCLYIKCALFS